MSTCAQKAEEKIKYGYLAGGVSVVVNVALFGLKLWAGLTTQSLALIADAWHTLSDSLSSLIVMGAVKLSSRKADREHPFGHGRWEQIGAIFIAFLLAIVAYEFGKDAIEQLSERKETVFGTLAIVVTALSIVVKESLAQYSFYIAKKTNNTSIKADAWHHRSDALSSVVVLIGIFVSKYFWWIDSILGLVIALMLAHAAYEIVKESVTKLLGEAPSEDLIQQIKELAAKHFERDLVLHHFHLHNYVTHYEMTFHMMLPGEISLKEAHNLASEIEICIFEALGITATIHIEPIEHQHSDRHHEADSDLHP